MKKLAVFLCKICTGWKEKFVTIADEFYTLDLMELTKPLGALEKFYLRDEWNKVELRLITHVLRRQLKKKSYWKITRKMEFSSQESRYPRFLSTLLKLQRISPQFITLSQWLNSMVLCRIFTVLAKDSSPKVDRVQWPDNVMYER
ncbi:hypothetical protein WN51_12281 [Melipona quadrifasciata]|uniref:Uncharacterized protein n=1 Tax=Melipona quadrifasciata TaxID=166423 RepID=A0A0M9A1X8_9HYME|nr:hypothetical protein WN51_12281 [Melipona quadrifasciata]